MSRGFHYQLVLQDQFSQTFDKWDGALQRAARETEAMSSRIERSVSKMMMGVGAIIAASVPVMAASFMPFEDALARLGTNLEFQTKSLGADLQASADNAKAWASAHIQSATEVIHAQNEFATAGLNAEQSMAGVASATVLATATGDQLVDTAQLLASLFNTFGQTGTLAGMQMGEVFENMADSLASTIQRFQVQIGPLRQGLSYVTGQATQLNLSLNEVNTSLGILNTAGIRASQAGTGLQNVFIRMDEAIKDLGLDTSKFTDEMGNFTGIADFIGAIDDVSADMGPLERVLAIQEAFGQRAARTVLTLLQQQDTLRGVTRELDESSGAAERMAKIIEKTTSSQLTIALNNLKNFAQSVGAGLAPALQSLAGAFGGIFQGLSNMASQAPVATAAIIALAGAVTFATAAFLGIRAVMAVAGVQAVATAGAFTALLKAVGLPLLAGAAVFALGKFIVDMTTMEKVVGRFNQEVGGTGFQTVTDALGQVANMAAAARRELEHAAKAGENVSAKLLKKGGFDPSEITALSSGRGATDALGSRLERVLSENFDAFGVKPEDIEKVTGPVLEAIKRSQELGVSLENSIRGAGSILGIGKRQILGDVAPAFEAILGQITSAEKKFIAEAEALSGKSYKAVTDILNPAALQELNERARELQGVIGKGSAWAGSFTGTGGAMSADALVNRAESFLPSIRDLAEVYKKFSTEVIRNPEIRADLASIFPELGKALGENAGTSFRAAFEGSVGDADEIGKSILGGLLGGGLLNSRDNDFTALTEIATRVANVKEILGDAFVGTFGQETGTNLVVMGGLTEQVSELDRAFTTLATSFGKIEEGFKKGFTVATLSQALTNVNSQLDNTRDRLKMFEAMQPMAARTVDAMLKNRAALFGQGADPAAQALFQFAQQQMKTSAEAIPGLRNQVTALEDMQKRYENLIALVQQYGTNLTQAGLTEGASQVADAFSSSMLLGDFETFRSTLYESMFKTIRSSIADGVAEGFTAALGLNVIFDTDTIKEAYKKALEGAGSSEELDSRLRAAESSIMGQVEGGLNSEQTKQRFEAITESAGRLMSQMANLVGAGDLYKKSVEDATKASIEGFDKQNEAVARLQASLITATGAERQFYESAIAFERGVGNIGGGVDVSNLGLEEKLQAITRLIERAQDMGLSNVSRSLTGQATELLQELEERKRLAGEFGQAMQTASAASDALGKAAKQTEEALTEAGKTRTEFTSIATDLQTAQKAAEAIRDALAEVRAGSTMPSSITVGGNTGASSQFSVTVGGTQIVVEAGAAIEQEDLDTLERKIASEQERQRRDIIEQLRQLRPR